MLYNKACCVAGRVWNGLLSSGRMTVMKLMTWTVAISMIWVISTYKVTSAQPCRNPPAAARREAIEVERLLDQLNALHGKDSKRDQFFEVIRQVTDDDRALLVFTEYADTLRYVRDNPDLALWRAAGLLQWRRGAKSGGITPGIP